MHILISVTDKRLCHTSNVWILYKLDLSLKCLKLTQCKSA